MNQAWEAAVEEFRFRDLHPRLHIGTASDRYAGWVGQIYTSGRYDSRITKREKRLGKLKFTEEVLPVESVQEYFTHFSLLELDFTFYQLLRDSSSKPTSAFFTLNTYQKQISEQDHVFLKVSQSITAPHLRKSENPDYLNPETFKNCFYQPAIELLGSRLKGFIFEQEYIRKEERPTASTYVSGLEAFFSKIPPDDRYHLEARTSALMTKDYFAFLSAHGIGQVLSHWTWLPSLREQFAAGNNQIYNRSNHLLLRLVTPRNMRYEDTYSKAQPFSALIPGMMDPAMLPDAVTIIQTGLEKQAIMYVSINNRSGGNAPLIAQLLVKQLG